MDRTVSVLDLVCLPDSSKSEQCVYTWLVCVFNLCNGVCVCAGTRTRDTQTGQKQIYIPLQISSRLKKKAAAAKND